MYIREDGTKPGKMCAADYEGKPPSSGKHRLGVAALLLLVVPVLLGGAFDT